MTELVSAKNKVQRVANALEDFMPRIRAVLPQQITAAHVANVFLNVLSTTPRLAECDVPSLLGALLKCSQFGLVPDGISNRAHIVPRKQKAVFQLGYKGAKELAERHPSVRVVYPPVAVFEKDEFDYSLGLEPKLFHKPCQSPDRGKLIAFYCVANLANGAPPVFKWLWRHEVDVIRDATDAWKSGKMTPWRTHYEAMGCKTACSALCKQLPSTPELAEAVALDERGDVGLPQNLDIIDVDTESVEGPSTASEPKQLSDLVPDRPMDQPPPKRRGRPPKAKAAASEQSEEDLYRTNILKNWGHMNEGRQAALLNNCEMQAINEIETMDMPNLQSVRDAMMSV